MPAYWPLRVAAASPSLMAILASSAAFAAPPRAADLPKATLQALADTYAGSLVSSGAANGVAVGIVIAGRPAAIFTYGLADVAAGAPFTADSLFEIGSVTKVFTTNLLGQEVSAGKLSLNDRLERFTDVLGLFHHGSGKPTLKELGDFTAGFPDYAPLCVNAPSVKGCLPSQRPPIEQYTARDFARFFTHTTTQNYNCTPPVKAAPPVEYLYSDFSIGLLGLLLGSTPNHLIDNRALDGWWSLTQSRLLGTLHMDDTFLNVPPQKQALVAQGYELAGAQAIVSNGQIASVTVSEPGGGYTTVPIVTVSGGGGSGASLTATVEKGEVTGIAVSSGGQGYTAPPSVTFSGGGATSQAIAQAVIVNGAVAGIQIINAGAGYTSAPTVTIAGGGASTNATATANIASGHLSFVTVTNAGAGYLPPLTISVQSGNAFDNGVPIWAPAGALLSSIHDMSRFTAAALGETEIGGDKVPPLVSAGFRIAQTPYACEGANPNILTCTPPLAQSGLAWVITPPDQTNGYPMMVSKDGGLGGFSTQVDLLPSEGLGVVAFVNNEKTMAGAPRGCPGTPQPPENLALATAVARDVLNALFYARQAK